MSAKIDAAMIEELSTGKHPAIERDLVELARRGELAGIVTKPPRYSASTIQNFVDCQRLFYWPTLAGLGSPASPAQAFGTRLHKYAEDWMTLRAVPPTTNAEGRLVSLGLPLMPTPFTAGLSVEEKFEFSHHGLPVITGTKDFVVRPQHKGATAFVLGDHKTSRSKRWAKSKQWLEKNVQANLYAFAEWHTLKKEGFDGLTHVDKQWLYYYKDEKQVDKLRVLQPLEDVGEQFHDTIAPAVKSMAEMVRTAPKISDIALPDDRATCEAYGGCPHRLRCFSMGQGSTKMGILAGKFSKTAIAQVAASAQAASAPATGAGAAINPPAPRVIETPPQAREPVLLLAKPTEAAVDAMVAEQADVAPTQEEPKAKRTRRTKAEIEAAKQAEAPAAVAIEEAQDEPRPFSMSPMVPGSNPAHAYWLTIGGRITRGSEAPVVEIDQLVGRAQIEATRRSGKEHFRQDFGGHAVLEACFADWMEENAITGVIYIPREMSPSARDVLGLLRAHAALVWE